MKTLIALTALLVATTTFAKDNTGDYCSANPKSSACVVKVNQPNLLPTPVQINWGKHPIYANGGQPPKNAK